MDCVETGQRNVKQTPSGEPPQRIKYPNNSWIAERRKEISLNYFIYSFSAKNTHTGVPWAAIPLKIEFLVFTSFANQFRGEKHKSRLYLSKWLFVSLLSKLSSSSFSLRFWKYLLVKLNAIFHPSFNSQKHKRFRRIIQIIFENNLFWGLLLLGYYWGKNYIDI